MVSSREVGNYAPSERAVSICRRPASSWLGGQAGYRPCLTGARAAAKHPAVHRTAPQVKGLSGPKCQQRWCWETSNQWGIFKKIWPMYNLSQFSCFYWFGHRNKANRENMINYYQICLTCLLMLKMWNPCSRKVYSVPDLPVFKWIAFISCSGKWIG